MKLLIVTPEFISTGGGIATYYRELASGLVSLGVEVTVIEGSALALRDGSKSEHDGIKVHTLDRRVFERQKTRFAHLSAAPRLARHLAAGWAAAEQMDFGRSFDVIEATDWGFLFAPFVISGEVAVNVQCHASIGQIGDSDPIAGTETETALTQCLESHLLARCQSLQTYSQANANFWANETQRSVELQYPVFASQIPDRGKLETRGLVVGRFQRWKGPHILAEALQCLGQRAPDMTWIGRDVPWGDSRKMTSDYIRETYPSTLGQSIELVGPVTPSEVRRRQARARFNLVPSTWDVFNFTAAEALDSGRPTIVSLGAGASELVQDGKNGFLFEPNDPSSLADAIARVQELSDDECDAIGAAARKTVQDLLDPKTLSEKRLSYYRKLTNTKHSISGWGAQIASPRDDLSQLSELDFLDEFSMRRILSYLKRRLLQKMSQK